MKIGNFNLDNEQEEAATSNCNHILVVAGAGTGKTTTILGRIKYLLPFLKNSSFLILIYFYKICLTSHTNIH